MDENQPAHGFHGFHNSFYFDDSFFHFSRSGRDFADNKYLLHFAQYNNEVVPDSFKRPYLVKITSEWCFTCIHIEPVWKETVQELEALGKTHSTALADGVYSSVVGADCEDMSLKLLKKLEALAKVTLYMYSVSTMEAYIAVHNGV